jgi:amino acid transporter
MRQDFSAGPAQRVGPAKLAKVVGMTAVAASALAYEFGSGITYVAPQSVAAYPGVQGLASLAMLVMGMALLPKTHLLMRFTRVMPTSGSIYGWMSRTVSLPVSFVVTVLYLLGVISGVGVVAYATSDFLASAMINSGMPGAEWVSTSAGHLVVGIVAIAVMLAVQLGGATAYSRVVRFAAVVILVAVVLVLGYFFATPSESLVAHVSTQTGMRLSPPDPASRLSVSDFLSVCVLFFAAYGGLLAAPSLGGEAKDPKRSLSRGTFWGWAVSIVLYTTMTFAFFLVVPWWAAKALVDGGHATVVTVPGIFGIVAPSGVAAVVDWLFVFIVLKCLAPQLMVASRTVFALAQDGLLPAVFARTTKRSKSPVTALLLATVCSLVFVAQTTLSGFTGAMTVRAISLLVVQAVIAFGVLRIRFGRGLTDRPWAGEIGRGTTILVSSVCAIVIAVILIAESGHAPGKVLLLQPWFQCLVTMALATIVYGWARLRSRREGVPLGALMAQLPAE